MPRHRDLEAHYHNLYGPRRWYHRGPARFAVAAGAQTVAAAGGAGYWLYKSALGM